MEHQLARELDDLRRWETNIINPSATKSVFTPKNLSNDLITVIRSDIGIAESPAAVKAIFKQWERAVLARHGETDWETINRDNLPPQTKSYIKSLSQLKISVDHLDRAGAEHYKGIIAAKALTDIRSKFEKEAESLFNLAMNKKSSEKEFEAAFLNLVSLYSETAMVEGFSDGGVPGHILEPIDVDWLGLLHEKQVVYVRNVTAALYADKRLTPKEIKGKPPVWWRMSIMPAYNEGLARASKDGVGVFVPGPTEQKCRDCIRLAYKARRFSFWLKYFGGELVPCSKTECGGFNCKCQIVPFRVPANRGRLPTLYGPPSRVTG